MSRQPDRRALRHGLDVRKAWVEMIHRYAAGTLSDSRDSTRGVVVIARAERGVNVPLAFVALALILFQGMLGMLDSDLAAEAADRHRAPARRPHYFRAAAVAVAVDALQDQPVDGARAARGNRVLEGGATRTVVGRLALAALALQVFLGGWTSSNYAAMACPDFPRCQNQWVPEADYKDAFVLWRGLGINYAGGVLDPPGARGHSLHAPSRARARHAPAVARGTCRIPRASARVRAGRGWQYSWPGTATLDRVFMVLRAFPCRSQRRTTPAPPCSWRPPCAQPQPAAGGGLS
jgi:hypothetical protein